MVVYQAVTVTCGKTSVRISVSSGIHAHVCDLASTFDAGSPPTTAIELHARFLEHCAAHGQDAALAILDAMCREHGIPSTSVHIVVQQHGLVEAAAQRVLRAYYLLWNVEGARHCYFAS
ncbi:hypothetical protein LPJ61_006191, partial [Coemansia biformis]